MHSPRFYVDYALHFLMSHSRHGTHSPFVYQLVDEVIYAPGKEGEPREKVQRLMSRLASRFKSDFVVAGGDNVETITSQLGQTWSQLHAGSVLVLNDIYRSRRMKALWRIVQERPDVTVTIDLFHLGLVFFHKGQAKEDFRIRF